MGRFTNAEEYRSEIVKLSNTGLITELQRLINISAQIRESTQEIRRFSVLDEELERAMRSNDAMLRHQEERINIASAILDERNLPVEFVDQVKAKKDKFLLEQDKSLHKMYNSNQINDTTLHTLK